MVVGVGGGGHALLLPALIHDGFINRNEAAVSKVGELLGCMFADLWNISVLDQMLPCQLPPAIIVRVLQLFVGCNSFVWVI